jgi:hypothetical protein
VPFTVWEKAHHENWDKSDWDKFLNDPFKRANHERLPRLAGAGLRWVAVDQEPRPTLTPGLVSSAPVLQGTSPMDTFAGSRQADG